MDPRRRRKSAPVRRGPRLSELWLPALLLLALLVATVVVAGSRHRRKIRESEAESPALGEANPDPEPEHVPFSSVAGPETSVWRSRIRGETADPESSTEEEPAKPAEGLLARPVWKQAVGWAEQAQAWLDKAEACREEGDVDGFRKNGREAKKQFQKALDSTAAFYENVVQQHGEIDSQVSSIRRTRATWQEKHVALHKLIRF